VKEGRRDDSDISPRAVSESYVEGVKRRSSEFSFRKIYWQHGLNQSASSYAQLPFSGSSWKKKTSTTPPTEPK